MQDFITIRVSWDTPNIHDHRTLIGYNIYYKKYLLCLLVHLQRNVFVDPIENATILTQQQIHTYVCVCVCVCVCARARVRVNIFIYWKAFHCNSVDPSLWVVVLSGFPCAENLLTLIDKHSSCRTVTVVPTWSLYKPEIFSLCLLVFS